MAKNKSLQIYHKNWDKKKLYFTIIMYYRLDEVEPKPNRWYIIRYDFMGMIFLRYMMIQQNKSDA